MDSQIYDDFNALFRQPGWKLIIEDFQRLAQQAIDINTIEDGQALAYRKGQLDILSRLLNYQSAVRQQEALNRKEEEEL